MSGARSRQADRNIRALAAEVVAQVLSGASLDDALPAAQARVAHANDRALLQALAFGVLRDYRLLAVVCDRLLTKPLRKNETRLHALLLVGLHQLRSMRIPQHAAVAETVSGATVLGKSAARGLVNATLRRYLRERETMEGTLPADYAVQTSHPDWLAALVRNDWPGRWQEVLAANTRPGPMTLRVNQRHKTRDEYLRELSDAGIAATAAPSPEGVLLGRAQSVETLPAFAAGHVSVQDAAAQFAAPLLDPLPRQRVLDACAAPGGKTCHLLELAPDIELLALDRDAQRLQRVRDNLTRLQLRAECRAGDARNTADWWDGRLFDRILLDAPCSGTGVSRRHPDIKWLRRESDIAVLATAQRAMLEALWPLLVPGGVLLYASCSLLAVEGPQLLEGFVASRADARERVIEASWGERCAIGRRIAPGEQDMDGFYYARLEKAI